MSSCPTGGERSMTAPLQPQRRLCLAASLTLLFELGGCAPEPEPTLRIGTNVWIGCEPLYLARELGHLSPKAVQLVEYPSASEVMRAFRNQAIDGMVISLDELFGLAVDGLQPRIVLVADVSNGADVVVGRPGMRSMKDLKGKRIAVESGALGAFMLSRALALNEMQAGDVAVVHLESNEHPSAFEKGQVDGAVTFDPYRIRLIQAGAAPLFDSTRIPGEIVDLIAVRASVLEQQPKAVQALLAGWFDAIGYLERDPEDAARRMGIRQQTRAAVPATTSCRATSSTRSSRAAASSTSTSTCSRRASPWVEPVATCTTTRATAR
jgi:NitT/TauT family transport system substrate-binding protein